MLDEIADLVFDIISPAHWRFWLCVALSILGVWLAYGHLPDGGLRVGAVVGAIVAGIVVGVIWEAAS
jgi:uncharacterized BrkB/YihY/UPF0761 family membrane protein